MRRRLAMSRLTARISPVSEARGFLDDLLFDLVEPCLELVDFGPVVVDHRVDDSVHQRDRAFRQDVPGPRAQLTDMLDAAALAVVNGDQEVRRQEEVGLAGVERVIRHVEIDAVQNDVEMAAVGLDLGIGLTQQSVLDREFVQAELIAQHGPIGLGRLGHVRPDHSPAVG